MKKCTQIKIIYFEILKNLSLFKKLLIILFLIIVCFFLISFISVYTINSYLIYFLVISIILIAIKIDKIINDLEFIKSKLEDK